MTGKCHKDHNRPSTILGANPLLAERILGNAYPVQPISSKKPAGMPNRMPTRNRLGAYIGETNRSRKRRTARTRTGGISNAMYHLAEIHARDILENRRRMPLFPSTILVDRTQATLGPRSMAGNIRMPVRSEEHTSEL